MSLLRLLAVRSLLSLTVVAPLVAGCESDNAATPQGDGGLGSLPADDGGAGADASVPSTCAPLTGAGTKHGQTPTADEIWTAAASPHVVDSSLSIPAALTITVEPCAVVQLKGGVGLTVKGKLLAQGAADKPIRIERGDAATGWTTIEASQGSELRLAYVTLDGGGNALGGRPTQAGALDIRGNQDVATQPVFFADHVTVKRSESLGVVLREGGGFAPGSKDISITGGATFPISAWARAAGTLPTGSYKGNAVDEILLPANGGRDDVQEDTTFADHGVPYRIGGPTGGKALTVGAQGSVALLTIEPGVTLRFDAETRLALASTTQTGPATGALRAEGTPDKPIVFTSSAAAPAAGDWVGIVIGGVPDARNKISNATISYAGGASQISSFDCQSPLNAGFSNEGAILVIGGQPAGAFVTNTVIDSSAGDGVVRGWTGDPVELTATNTFTNITRCNQTFPKPTVGACPAPAPCPK